MKHRTVPPKRYFGSETETFRREIVISSLCVDTKIFKKHNTIRFKNFLALKQNFRGKIVILPLCLDTRNIMKHKILPLQRFQAMRQISPTRNRDTRLCLDTRIFLEHKTVPLQIFSILWDKNFLTEKCATSSLSRYQKFSESQNSAPTNFFGTVRQKFFDKMS